MNKLLGDKAMEALAAHNAEQEAHTQKLRSTLRERIVTYFANYFDTEIHPLVENQWSEHLHAYTFNVDGLTFAANKQPDSNTPKFMLVIRCQHCGTLTTSEPIYSLVALGNLLKKPEKEQVSYRHNAHCPALQESETNEGHRDATPEELALLDAFEEWLIQTGYRIGLHYE